MDAAKSFQNQKPTLAVHSTLVFRPCASSAVSKPERAPLPPKVFVGGIPRSVVKSNDLKAHFAHYGEEASGGCCGHDEPEERPLLRLMNSTFINLFSIDSWTR
jgi:hypothetical protein